MRYLFISDIHSNWEALEAVLAAARGEYDRIICCGDFIGYGADPNRVLDWARSHVSYAVRGNHDRACADLADLEWFNPVARAATLWTHDELTTENAAYILSLPKGPVEVEDFGVLHGSPLHEDEYLTTLVEAKEAFGYVAHPVTFFGHTHLQGGFEYARGKVRIIHANATPAALEFDPDAAYLINPGSVGQPRDGDQEAGFVIYDPRDNYLVYHRVPYDVNSAQTKIRNAGLPPVLADRLSAGR